MAVQEPLHVHSPPAAWAIARERQVWRDSKGWDAGAPPDVRRLAVSQGVPVVDLAAYLAGAPGAAQEAAARLRHACAAVGFYHITGYEAAVPRELLDAAFRAAERYFAQPEDVKLRAEVGAASPLLQPIRTGYTRVGARVMPPREQGNLLESFIVSNHARALYETHLAMHEAAAGAGAGAGGAAAAPFAPDPPLPWPADLGPSWRQVVEDYVAHMGVLAGKLLALIALALGLDAEYFGPATAPPGPLWRLRLCAYPADPRRVAEGAYGMPPHVDTSLLTIVASEEAEEPGLALHCEGLGGWVRAPARPGALLVNTGDVLQSMTNDAWPAARHYVGNPSETRRRLSLAYFINAAPAARMEVLPSFVTPERPAKYLPTSWMEGQGVHRGGFFRLARPPEQRPAKPPQPLVTSPARACRIS